MKFECICTYIVIMFMLSSSPLCVRPRISEPFVYFYFGTIIIARVHIHQSKYYISFENIESKFDILYAIFLYSTQQPEPPNPPRRFCKNVGRVVLGKSGRITYETFSMNGYVTCTIVSMPLFVWQSIWGSSSGLCVCATCLNLWSTLALCGGARLQPMWQLLLPVEVVWPLWWLWAVVCLFSAVLHSLGACNPHARRTTRKHYPTFSVRLHLPHGIVSVVRCLFAKFMRNNYSISTRTNYSQTVAAVGLVPAAQEASSVVALSTTEAYPICWVRLLECANERAVRRALDWRIIHCYLTNYDNSF